MCVDYKNVTPQINLQSQHSSKNQKVSSALWEGVRETDKLILKCIRKCKGLRIAMAIWEKNTTAECILILRLILSYSNMVWFWYKGDQCYRRKRPKQTRIYDRSDFCQRRYGNEAQGKDDRFNKCGSVNWIAIWKKKNLALYLTHLQNEFQCGYTVIGKTIKCSEENVRAVLILETTRQKFPNKKALKPKYR